VEVFHAVLLVKVQGCQALSKAAEHVC